MRIVGAGNPSAEAAIITAPVVTPHGSLAGSHAYCYVVDAVDPLGAIDQPSPQTCVSNLPDLGIATVQIALATTTSNVGPSPSFLWYVSEDGGPFQLLNCAKFVSDAVDLGQRVGARGGWPDSLPASDPNISKNEDLFSVVQGIAGNQITIADPLVTSISSAELDHDDTQAVQSAILAGVAAGGGNIVFGPGTFNIRRPAFAYVVNNSYAYPPFSNNLALDPWWAAFCYLYIPNGSVGNINLQGAGRATTLVTPPDHGGVTAMLAVGWEARQGDPSAPVLSIEDTPIGSQQITITGSVTAPPLSPGDDIFLYYGSYQGTPDIDQAGYPDMHHYSELNTVAAVAGNKITLVYPTTKHYHDDGASSWGLHKLALTPHNIEIRHFNVKTSEPLTMTGEVIGMLVDDVQVQGTLSLGAFGGGYKRGLTIENSSWTFGEGTAGWGQLDEYDQSTDIAFLQNTISGYAALQSEGGSGMAKLYATEGTSQVIFSGNTFNHVSIYADQTNDFYIENNTFNDGAVAIGTAYGPPNANYWILGQADPSFVSFDSQYAASIDHNTFNIAADFAPDWVIRIGAFQSGNVSDNTINYAGAAAPWWMIGSFGGTVLRNSITVQSPTVFDIITLLPDQSPVTAMSSFDVEQNVTVANTIRANVEIADPGVSDTASACVVANVMHVTQGVALKAAPSIANQQCR